jgi:hypothetical protein
MKIEINVLEHPLTLATFASMFWMLNSKIKNSCWFFGTTYLHKMQRFGKKPLHNFKSCCELAKLFDWFSWHILLLLLIGQIILIGPLALLFKF